MDNATLINDQTVDPSQLDVFNPDLAKPKKNILPAATMKTRAANAALLSGSPDDIATRYQAMLADQSNGDGSAMNSLQAQLDQQNQKIDMQAMTSILSDSNVPYEQKKQLVEAFPKAMLYKEPTVQLATAALESASSGETPDNEVARISTADMLAEIHQANETIQSLVNAKRADLNWKNAATIGDTVIGTLLPFGTNIQAAKMSPKGLWNTIKAFVAPGSQIERYREQFFNLPPEQRVAFAQNMIENISNNSGIILSSRNQLEQLGRMEDILGEGGYSSTMKWIENSVGVLDIIGIGQIIRGVGKGSKTVSEASKAAKTYSTSNMPVKAATGAVEGSSVVSEGVMGLRPLTVDETAGKLASLNDRKIVSLEAERNALLETSSGEASKGTIAKAKADIAKLSSSKLDATEEGIKAQAKTLQGKGVSYKEAFSQARKNIESHNASIDASIKRLEQTIESNAAAAKANQRIAELDSAISRLKALRPDSPGALTPIAEAVRRIDIQSVTHLHNPSSPAAILQNTNPQRASAAHAAVFKSEGDAVAEALYGTSRVEAITGDVVPQVLTEGGKVLTKPVDIQRSLVTDSNIDPIVRAHALQSGGTEFALAERQSALANVSGRFNDFASAGGLHPIDPMGGFKLDGNTIKISSVYGTPEGAFSTAREAYDQAIRAFRTQGITPDEITVMRKQGIDHVPVKWEDYADVEGNYLVRVETDHIIDPTDVTEWIAADVKRNFFDRVPQLVGDSGGFSRMIFDAASMLHRVYTSAAITATDRAANFEKVMLDIATEFSDRFTKLSKGERGQVAKYIREANANGIPLDHADVLARGMNDEQFQTLVNWRKFWDAHYYLENLDVVRTFNQQGFKRLVSPNADVFVRPLNSYQGVTKVYDATMDMVINTDPALLKQLYAQGGQVGKLRRPTQFGQDTAEYVIIRNNSSEYTRTLRDTDQVLNKRDGYYQVQYTAPRFVDETDVNGITRAVAVAGDTKEAEAFANRMRSINPNNTYNVRADDRAMRTESDDWFDVNSAGGRISQRHRGKLLEASNGTNILGNGDFVLDPVESAIRASKSISGRTVMRPVLEAAKERFMSQYGRFAPSDGMGGKRFPRSVKELGAKGEQFTSELADARTTFGYIHYLENGYINSMDQVFKSTFMALADMLGKQGYSKAERAAMKVSETSITGLGKGSTFLAYLATNPLRQWVVQAHQGVRTIAYNPVGWANGSIEKLLGGYVAAKSTLARNLSKETNEFVDFIDSTGMLEAVDKQNLVRGTLLSASDASNKTARAVGYLPNVARKYGYDVGEKGNLLMHLAAVYERYKRMGKNVLDKTVREDMASEARAISYDMNFAGDMPYNQNSAGMLLQFMQVPHKAFLQTTNRRIDTMTKLRMIGADIVLWGVPGAAAISAVMGGDILPDNRQERDLFMYGAESLLLNEYLRKVTDDPNLNIDFSSLAPYDVSGWSKFLYAMLTGGPSQMIQNSPAGQLWLKDGGRIQKAIGSMARYFGLQEDYGDNATDALTVLNEIAKISSGFSNAQKAYLALETHKVYDKYGNTISEINHPIQAYLMAFGFQSSSQRDLFLAAEQPLKNVKSHKDEVLRTYNQVRMFYLEKLNSGNMDPVLMKRVSSVLLSRFKNDPVAIQIINEQLKKDLADPKQKLLGLMLKAENLPTADSMKDSIRVSPISEEQKQLLLQRIEDMQQLRNQK